MSERIVLKVTRESDLAWAWIPYILRRVYTFCEKMDTETLPQEAEDLVRAWFCIGDKRLGLWAIIDKDKGLVGHLFCTTEPAHLDTWRYILIRQAEVDKGIDVRAECMQVRDELVDWTKSLGLNKIMMVTHRDVNAMARRWGFKMYKSLMKLNLDGGKDGR